MISKKLSLVSCVLVLAGGLFWYQRGNLAQLESENAALRATTDQTQERIELCRAERSRTEAQSLEARAHLARLEQRLAMPPGEILAGSPGPDSGSGRSNGSQTISYVSLSKTNLHRLRLRPLTEDFHLTDEAAAILGMSGDERAAVDGAVDRLISAHNDLDLSKIQPAKDHLTAESGRKTSFRVPAYPEEGQKLLQEMLESTQQAIGSNRTAILLGYADLNSLSAEGFEPFGRTEKIITFLDRLSDDGKRGDCQIFMKVVDANSGFSLQTSFANFDDEIPLNWRHLIQNIDPSR